MEKTKAWRLYEAGKGYNNKLKPNYYDTVDTNHAFFNGDQWRNIEADNMPKPTFNVIKRVITFLVASLTSSKATINFEPLTGTDGLTPFDDSKIAAAQVKNLFEKFKMDTMIKDGLFDSAITGDCGAHFYFDMDKIPYGNVVTLSNGMQIEGVKGEICRELIDGTNVYFGNANSTDVQGQPYLIISGRDTVQNLQDEKIKYMKIKQAQQQAEQEEDPDLSSIQYDSDTQHMAGDSGKIEVDVDSDGFGKALYIIVYQKRKVPYAETNAAGMQVIKERTTVFTSKSIEKTYIYENIDTGLSKYPFAWMNWEKKKNSYHGLGLATHILPNQIFINRAYAMVMYHLMNSAFPKAVYNADFVPEWNNEIGAAIPIYGTDINTNIRNIAGYLEPAQMSNQIMNVIELAMTTTKDMLGINDTSLGNVAPDNTSAILAVQKSAAIPLENPKANLYQWLEDIGEILFDMMGTYYGQRPLPIDVPMQVQTGVDPMTGQPIMEEKVQKQVISYDFNRLKDLWFNTRVDIGESSYWSEIASNQTLSNMLGAMHIDIIQYLERTSDELIPDKEKLIQELKVRMQQQQQAQAAAEAQAAAQQQAPTGGQQ